MTDLTPLLRRYAWVIMLSTIVGAIGYHIVGLSRTPLRLDGMLELPRWPQQKATPMTDIIPRHHEPSFIIPRTGELVPMPQTDTEVLRLLDYEHATLTITLRTLYMAHRDSGDDVLTAYRKTLEALQTVIAPRSEGRE